MRDRVGDIFCAQVTCMLLLEGKRKQMATDVLHMIGELISQGKWDEAHSVLSKQAAQTPNDPQWEYELGVLCYSMGRFEEAERHLKTSLSIVFDSPESHYQLGLTLLKQNRAQEAMPEFRDLRAQAEFCRRSFTLGAGAC